MQLMSNNSWGNPRKQNTRRENGALRTPDRALAATRRPKELVGLAILSALLSIAYLLQWSVFYRSLNVIGPLTLMAILCFSAYASVRANSLNVWTPIFWYRLASAVYFGFGSIVPFIGSRETQAFLAIIYPVDDLLALKVNLIYCLGIFFTLAFYYVFSASPIKHSRYGGTDHLDIQKRRTFLFASAFLGAGFLLRYVVVLPYVLGFGTEVLPGAILTLSMVFYVGVYLLVVYCANFDRRLWLLAGVVISFDLLIAILSFQKIQLILLMIFVFLGIISHRANIKKIAICAVCVLAAYLSFQPVVMYGRGVLMTTYGTIHGTGLGERVEIITDYAKGGRESDVSGIQWGLLRLSYINTSAFVVQRHDSGMPGSTFVDAAAVFIPRALWPDKPIITKLGTDLNDDIYGSEASSIAPGHSSEAYWNFGWFGIVPYMAVLALILAFFTRFSLVVMSDKNWLYLPVVFIGVQLGLRVDGFFVSDTLGGVWMAIVLAGVIRVLQAVGDIGIKRRQKRMQGGR